jgi:hypothetical protein
MGYIERSGLFMSTDKKYLVQSSGGNFQIVMRIPTDLQPILNAKILKRSLKTSNPKDADLLLNSYVGKIQSSFTLLRSGVLNTDQIIALKTSILPSKRINTVYPALTLHNLILLYTSERSPNWTKPTALSFGHKFVMMVEHLGDKDVTSYSREDFLTYRNKLISSGLQPKTINTRLSLLSSLLKWGVRHGYLQQNHSESMLLKEDKAPDEQRKVYDLEDLKIIVSSLQRSTRCPWQYREASQIVKGVRHDNQ